MPKEAESSSSDFFCSGGLLGCIIHIIVCNLSRISEDTLKVVSLGCVFLLLHGLGGCPEFRVVQEHTGYHGPENAYLYFAVQLSVVLSRSYFVIGSSC